MQSIVTNRASGNQASDVKMRKSAARLRRAPPAGNPLVPVTTGEHDMQAAQDLILQFLDRSYFHDALGNQSSRALAAYQLYRRMLGLPPTRTTARRMVPAEVAR